MENNIGPHPLTHFIMIPESPPPKPPFSLTVNLIASLIFLFYFEKAQSTLFIAHYSVPNPPFLTSFRFKRFPSVIQNPSPDPKMPPSKPPALPPPPAQKHNHPTPLNQIVVSKQALNWDQQPPALDLTAGKSRKATLLRKRRRTNPIVWCCAIICLLFSLFLIFAGISTLIIFLVIKPRYPLLETTSATLNSVYLDSPNYLNGDFTFLANFSNPNRKIDVRFESLEIELYFFDKLIATQALQAFSLIRGEVRLEPVHMVTSEAYLPPNLALELRKQLQSNRVRYNIRGTFRVRLSLGLTHFSSWLHGRCQVELTSPPYGVLVARRCRTKR